VAFLILDHDSVEGDRVFHRICDRLVAIPTPDLEAYQYNDGFDFVGDTPTNQINLTLVVKPSGVDGAVASIFIRGESGEQRRRVTAEYEEVFDRVGIFSAPFDPGAAPWPYNDFVQEDPRYEDLSDFKYRVPDPGSGLVVSHLSIYGAPPAIIVANCRSTLMISADGRQLGWELVHPDDRSAFETFVAQVEVQMLT
jgi:hypothetical protein